MRAGGAEAQPGAAVAFDDGVDQCFVAGGDRGIGGGDGDFEAIFVAGRGVDNLLGGDDDAAEHVHAEHIDGVTIKVRDAVYGVGYAFLADFHTAVDNEIGSGGEACADAAAGGGEADLIDILQGCAAGQRNLVQLRDDCSVGVLHRDVDGA